jgi:2-amino-4-hydroxy-6-hydroxymethyldihydropteridine diphosphokinase
MPDALIALGSNVGDRSSQLGAALDGVAQLARTQLVALSRWHSTPPVGGPAGQGGFLNGAALIRTDQPPQKLLAELKEIETSLGRIRAERWAARTIDLDLLLYGGLQLVSPELTLPHPRMAFRRFVLEPAAEVAPWMVHSESRWTVAALLTHLDSTATAILVAGDDARWRDWLTGKLRASCPEAAAHIAAWTASAGQPPARQRPRLLLGPEPAPGVASAQWRRMLDLPPTGPIAWIASAPEQRALDEAVAAIGAASPAAAR